MFSPVMTAYHQWSSLCAQSSTLITTNYLNTSGFENGLMHLKARPWSNEAEIVCTPHTDWCSSRYWMPWSINSRELSLVYCFYLKMWYCIQSSPCQPCFFLVHRSITLHSPRNKDIDHDSGFSSYAWFVDPSSSFIPNFCLIILGKARWEGRYHCLISWSFPNAISCILRRFVTNSATLVYW